MAQKKSPGCLSICVGAFVAWIIFMIFPPSFLLAIPVVGVLLFKGAFKGTVKVVAQQVENQLPETTSARPVGPQSREEITQKVKEIVAAHFGAEPSELTEQTDLVKKFDADNLDAVELVIDLEEAYDIMFTDEEENRVLTIAEYVDLIKQKLDNK